MLLACSLTTDFPSTTTFQYELKCLGCTLVWKQYYVLSLTSDLFWFQTKLRLPSIQIVLLVLIPEHLVKMLYLRFILFLSFRCLRHHLVLFHVHLHFINPCSPHSWWPLWYLIHNKWYSAPLFNKAAFRSRGLEIATPESHEPVHFLRRQFSI